eukprot:6193189-Pleurochrysis_carterae.AAC.2
MRASRLPIRANSTNGLGAGAEADDSGPMHAATAGDGAASTATTGAVWLNGRSNAFKLLGGTYGSEPLLGWTCAECSCIARVARNASHRMRYARSQPGGEP